ncbi:MAG: hypothetical protein QOF33_4326 [Thermomicrobiales bacterium]|jgi:hypothetical protein|nr:hypothetical protein [Thermomicrobiales bacterium]MEA2597440.1 hypothetical protein [Thermomicrobiales bacterium]
MLEPDRSDTPRCHNCGIEIPWSPVIHQGDRFCCGGCAQGGPCYCSYDLATLNGIGPQWRRTRTATDDEGDWLLTTRATRWSADESR